MKNKNKKSYKFGSNILKYTISGLGFCLYSFFNVIYFLINYFLYGLYTFVLSIIIFIGKLFKYFFKGIVSFVCVIFKMLKKKKNNAEKKDDILVNKLKKKNIGQKVVNIEKESPMERKMAKERLKKAKIDAKKQRKEENKNLSLSDKFKAFVSGRYNNLSVVKDYKNRQEMKRQIMMIDFESDDVEKSDKKQTYIYEAKSSEGNFIRGKFDAFSKVDVHSFLLNEGYEVYDIRTSKWINFLYGSSGISADKYSKKDLIFFLTQLSTYIRSGIPLIDSLRIFSKQEKKTSKQKILQSIIYELVMGESFSNALDKQGNAFPKLLVNMIKTSEMTGELPDTLDDMANYYETVEKTRKQMISAMTYPSIVFVMAVTIITFIMLFVIPQFVDIYNDMNAEIPAITSFVIGVSNFLGNYWPFVFGGLVLFIVIFILLYKKIKLFRTGIQFLIMKLPVFGNIIIYNEITMFTKTFGSLLEHNVFITDSMEILSKITNNEIYKMIIFDTMTNLAKGESISKSFKNHWAFPVVAYEMLLTGERTGELSKMMNKVSDFYQEQHTNLVTQMKSFIEPIMISFLAFVVGGILLAVIIPMFGMYNQL